MKRFWSCVGVAALIAGSVGLAVRPAALAAEGDDAKEVSVAKRAGGKTKTLEGKVESFRKNPHGDVDGLTLDGGEEVRFPPHRAAEVQKAVGEKDAVRVEARRHVGPKGDEHWRADRIVNVKSEKEVVVEVPPKSVALKGAVESFRKNPHGDVDGLVLVGGQEVRFPPHVGVKVAEAVRKGDEVRIDAEEKTSPRGEPELRGMALVLAKGGDEIDLSAPPPHGPKDHGPKEHGKPRPPHERGADHGPPHERGVEHAPPHERILSELREIRELVDGKGKPHEGPHGAPHERMLSELREIRELLGVKGKPREEEHGPPHEQVLRELRELKEAVKDRSSDGRRPDPMPRKERGPKEE